MRQCGRKGERIALGPCLVIRNRLELRDEGEFVTLRALDQFGVHMAYRRIIHLTIERGQRTRQSETRDGEVLHDRLVRSYSAVGEISANDTSQDTRHTVWRYCFLLRC